MKLYTTLTALTLLIASSLTVTQTLAAKAPSVAVGMDISYPQCGKRVPTKQAFGIVGVNGGNANKYNPCLSTQLKWAAQSSGLTSQPKTQLYINTGNPGQVISQVTTWPTVSTATNPYNACDGTNTLACSWQYGYNRAEASVNYFEAQATLAAITATTGNTTWWLDVEMANTWQEGTAESHALNAASLEGATAYLQSRGAKVGIYSVKSAWDYIIGTEVGVSRNLAGLDSWAAGALTQNDAAKRCSTLAPFTVDGRVTLTQYVSGGYDYDYSCI